MPLPTLSKTWQFNVNNTQAAQGSQLASNQKAMRAIKNALKGFGTNPWTVVSSSNSTTANSSDNWSADTDLVWANAGTAHSWIVLKQAGIATNFQVLIALEPASGTGANVRTSFSPSVGFTGGTTTARPTATDETIIAATDPTPANNGNTALSWHALQSTDGQVSVVTSCTSTHCNFLWVFAKPNNPVTGWTNPAVCLTGGASNGTEYPTYANLSSNANFSALFGSTTLAGFLTSEGQTSAILANTLTLANEIDASWPFFPLGFASTTVGGRGRHGTLFDMWFGSTTRATGDTYPADSSRQFAQFGNLILPWNGTAVSTG